MRAPTVRAPTPRRAEQAHQGRIDKENVRPGTGDTPALSKVSLQRQGSAKIQVTQGVPELQRRGSGPLTTLSTAKPSPRGTNAEVAQGKVLSRRHSGGATTAGPASSKKGAGKGRDVAQRLELTKIENDKLEEELNSLRSLREAAEAAATAAEASAREAEQALTSGTAGILSEYATTHARVVALETELETTKQQLVAREAKNLQLSRQNLKLDKEVRLAQVATAEALDLLKQHESSQGSLDSKLTQQLQLCEDLRNAAARQSARIKDEMRRFSTMRLKLSDLLLAADASPPVTAVNGGAATPRTPRPARGAKVEIEVGRAIAVLEDAETAEHTLQEAFLECQTAVEDGVLPLDDTEADAVQVDASTAPGIVAVCSGHDSIMSSINGSSSVDSSRVELSAIGDCTTTPETISSVEMSKICHGSWNFRAAEESADHASASSDSIKGPSLPPIPSSWGPLPASVDQGCQKGLEARLGSLESKLDKLTRCVLPPQGESSPLNSTWPQAGQDCNENCNSSLFRFEAVLRKAQELEELRQVLEMAPEKMKAMPKEQRDLFLQHAAKNAEKLRSVDSCNAACPVDSPPLPSHELASMLH